MLEIDTEIKAFITKYGLRKGIFSSTISTLKRYGVRDARALTVMTEEEIQNIPNISHYTAQTLKEVAHEVIHGTLYQNGTDYIEKQLKKQAYFTTGSENIDALLGGGLRTGILLEVAGDSRTGKTQFCMTCAVTAQLPKKDGGVSSPVIYIDTTNSFDVQHYLKIGERFKLKQKVLLKNLFIVKAEQLRFLKEALNRLPGYVQALNAKLVVIDSFIAPYEHEHPAPIDFPIVQKEFYVKLGLLKRLAIGFNCTVLLTNHVIANLRQGNQYLPFFIAGGPALAHTSDVRLYLKKLMRNCRRMKIEHCSWLPNEHADFYLTSRGIYNEEEYPEHLLQKKVKSQDDESQRTPMMEVLKEIAEMEVGTKPSKKKK